MIKGKRTLVTGATGFIGSNLTREFLRLGAELYIFTRTTSDKWRISDIMEIVKEYRVDLLDRERLEAAVEDIKPEIILHTATYGGLPFERDEAGIRDANIKGAMNLVNACRRVGFDVFINTGSSSEYGLKEDAMKETDLLEPCTTYGAAKASATLFCHTRARTESLPIITLRLFSPYGYYEDSTRLIPSAIIHCLGGKDPQLSSPESMRDFVFIEDILDGYVKAVKNRDKAGGEIFNIGYGSERSVGEVVNNIIELTGGKVKPRWQSIPNPRIEPKRWEADVAKARKILDWHPRHELRDGLKKTIEWFKENIGLYEQKETQRTARHI